MALTKLEIRLEAETSRLQKDLDRANRKIKRWANKASKASASVGRAFKRVGFAAAAGAAGVAILVKNSLAAGDALAKTADKLGITTEKLAGLQHAAELTGVAQETLNKALTKQQKAIFDADRGLLTYSQHFDKLGLSTAALKAQSPDEQFISIAEALNKLTNQTDKTAIAYDIFGGRGTALLNTLALGRDGLAAVAEEAKVLGIALTRVDAAKMEEANDTFTRMGAVVKGLGNSITIQLAPVLEALGDKFIEAAKESGGMVDFVGKGMNKLVGAVGFVMDAFNGLKVVWKGLEVAFAVVASVIVGLLNVIIAPFKALLGALAPFSTTAANALMTIEDVTTSVFNNIATKKAEFDAALAAPPPSEGLKLWVAEVQAAAQQVAEAKAASSPQAQADESLTLLVNTNEARLAAKKKVLAAEAALEQRQSALILSMRANVANASIGFLSLFANKSKSIAKVIIVIQKGLSIAQAIQNTAVAYTKALTIDPTGGLSARVALLGKIQVGLIAATGLGQLSQVGSGGGGGAPSIGSGGDIPVDNPFTPQQGQASQATFIILGGGGSSESELDDLMDRVSERLNEGSQVIIRRDSVQAQEILAAATGT